MKLISLTLIVMGILGINSCSQNARSVEDFSGIEWENSLVIPPCKGMKKNVGLAGAFSGFVNDKLIILGGANFPVGFPWTGDKKVWWQTLYVTDNIEKNDVKWQIHDALFTYPIAYGASVQLEEGILCIGGCDKDKCFKEVFLITSKNDSLIIDYDSYPDLPQPIANATTTLLDNKIYLAGGQNSMKQEQSLIVFYMLDLLNKEIGWQELPTWDGSSRAYAVSVAQGGDIYMFSGRSFGPDKETIMHTDAHVYSPQKNKWNKIEGEFPFMAGTAIAYNDDQILFLGGVNKILPTAPDHPGFSKDIYLYDISDNKLAKVSEAPVIIPVTTNIITKDNFFYITSGETQPGIRTPYILRGAMR